MCLLLYVNPINDMLIFSVLAISPLLIKRGEIEYQHYIFIEFYYKP